MFNTQVGHEWKHKWEYTVPLVRRWSEKAKRVIYITRRDGRDEREQDEIKPRWRILPWRSGWTSHIIYTHSYNNNQTKIVPHQTSRKLHSSSYCTAKSFINRAPKLFMMQLTFYVTDTGTSTQIISVLCSKIEQLIGLPWRLGFAKFLIVKLILRKHTCTKGSPVLINYYS